MKSQEAYAAIRDIIIKADPNESVPYSENYFAEVLGMSRTPIRAALQQLQYDGLINIIPHQGIVIRGISYEEAWQLFDLRKLVETYLFERSAGKLTADELDVLDKMIRAQEEMLDRGDYEAFIDDDLDFHFFMYRHYDNPQMKKIVMNYKDRLYRSRLRSLSQEKRAEKSIRDHYQMVQLLREEKQDEAFRVFKNHIITLESIFKKGSF